MRWYLRHVALLQSLAPATLASLGDVATRRDLRRGEPIYIEGDRSDRVFFTCGIHCVLKIVPTIDPILSQFWEISLPPVGLEVPAASTCSRCWRPLMVGSSGALEDPFDMSL